MVYRNKFSTWLLFIWIFVWMFFYIIRQNYANAQKSLIGYEQEQVLNLDIIDRLSWAIQQSIDKYQNNFDLLTDGSFQRYLSDEHPFEDAKYTPADLQKIVSYFTHNQSSKFMLRAPAATAFADMARAFWDNFDKKKKLYIVSAYRSYGFQKNMKSNGCKSSHCADPWASEHQAWLAVDIAVADSYGNILQMHTWSQYYKWMEQNAHKYGFHNTYQKWVDIDGKIPEHRHWRFLGVPFATYLNQNQLTIAQYFKNLKM